MERHFQPYEPLTPRLVRFGAAVLGLVSMLPSDRGATHVAHQLTRAATAVGANYAEARGAESRRDFVHKLRVAEKESREALYWLTLVAARWGESVSDAEMLAVEADELVAMLTASVRTAMRK